MEENKVSIIIPVHNAEKFIGKTIESVLNQTYKNWEMLIFNDKSKDNSLKIIKKYSEKDERIKVVDSKENVGVVAARNKLIEIATGEFMNM